MENGPFIDGLPIKNGGSLHSYVNVYQRVCAGSKQIVVYDHPSHIENPYVFLNPCWLIQ